MANIHTSYSIQLFSSSQYGFLWHTWKFSHVVLLYTKFQRLGFMKRIALSPFTGRKTDMVLANECYVLLFMLLPYYPCSLSKWILFNSTHNIFDNHNVKSYTNLWLSNFRLWYRKFAQMTKFALAPRSTMVHAFCDSWGLCVVSTRLLTMPPQ